MFFLLRICTESGLLVLPCAHRSEYASSGLRSLVNFAGNCALATYRPLESCAYFEVSFRALLMGRSSRSLWRASRQLVDGLPDCPSHLSEPAHANLMFLSHCHVFEIASCVCPLAEHVGENCLKSHTQSIIWEFGVQYCAPCNKKSQ